MTSFNTAFIQNKYRVFLLSFVSVFFQFESVQLYFSGSEEKMVIFDRCNFSRQVKTFPFGQKARVVFKWIADILTGFSFNKASEQEHT